MPSDYFTFEIDGERVGFYEERDDGDELFARVVRAVEDTVRENAFWVRYDGLRLLAFRYGAAPWSLLAPDSDVVPSAAWTIVARGLAEGEVATYHRLDESSGHVRRWVTLRRDRERVTELIDGQEVRFMRFDGGRVVEYGWGPAVTSNRADSRAEAVAGTPFEDPADGRPGLA